MRNTIGILHPFLLSLKRRMASIMFSIHISHLACCWASEDIKFPIRRPLSQWSVTFVEFIVLYELVKEEATGTHYWLVTATFTSTCLMTKTLFVVGFPFCCPCRYVDLVLIHVPLQQEEKASLHCGLTAILQVMSNNACAEGNS